MKKNKIQGSNVIASNGSKQPLHLIEYTQQSDQDGLLEYDGIHLYFTIGTTRKTVTLV